MCGRMMSTSTTAELVDYFDVDEPTSLDLRPDFNVTPSQHIPLVHDDEDGRYLDSAHWGLVPRWTKDRSKIPNLINARAETVAVKPSFRSAFLRRRCLIPADGFYEWQKVAGKPTKQPYLITASSGTPLAFAGLWETWSSPAGEQLRSCTIITCPANEEMSTLHHRMPVVLEPGAWDLWLDPDFSSRDALEGLLIPAASGTLDMRPVSTLVNNVRNNGPELLDSPSQAPLPGL